VTFVKATYAKLLEKSLRGGSPSTVREINWVADLMAKTFGGHRDWESLTTDDWERLRKKIELGRSGAGLRHKSLKRCYGHPKRIGRIASEEFGVRPPAFGFTTFRIAGEQQTPSTVNRIGKSPIASKAYDQHEIMAILEDAPPFERACCLLGLNGGMGLADIGNVQTTQFCMVTGWFDDSRSKTGKARRFRLWPETIQAIQEEMRRLPRSEEYPHHVFVGDKLKRPMVRKIGTMMDTQQINKRVVPFIRSRGFTDSRGFYGFRHTFQWAGAAIDSEATSDIMTHIPMPTRQSGRMSYDSGKHDRRRVNVTDFIRQWSLLGGSDDPEQFVASSESLYGTLPAAVPLGSGSQSVLAG
jgi:integrase